MHSQASKSLEKDGRNNGRRIVFRQHSRAHHDDSKRAPSALPSPHSTSMLLESTDEMNITSNDPHNVVKNKGLPPRLTKLIRPSPANNESRCPFGFSLYWDGDASEEDGTGLWYFCADGTGCKSHRGHLKKNPEDVKLSYRTVPPSELEYARQSMALNAETAIVQPLVAHRTGITLSQDQLRHCAGRSTEGGALDAITGSAGSVATHQSPVERLVQYLRNEQSLDFILLVHDNTATKLLTITRTGRNRGGSEHNAYCPNDADADTLSYAESIRKSLGLSGNTKLLLGAAWASHQQQRMFSMFPEALCADVTMGTNAEKRPLLVMTSKTSENKIVRVFQALMPSQCRWIFDWCFCEAFVKLYGVKAVERNKIILTDGDSQMYSPLVDLANDCQSSWHNSRHMLCMWHLINRGLKHQHLSEGRLTSLGKAQFGAVQNWMYSLSDSPETSEEFDLSLKLVCSTRSLAAMKC